MPHPQVKVTRVLIPGKLDNSPAEAVAFDLEMANSFTGAAPVICMIGLETYDPESARCVSEIGTILRREDEMELIQWFLSRLGEIRGENPGAYLLSFSGSDNDLPWIRERLARDGTAPRTILDEIPHVDLKLEFFRRTSNQHISLKGLETICGIDRESAIQSRKVSYILTDILKGKNGQRDIPEKIFTYLREDVHHLLVIRDRFDQVSLEAHLLTEDAYGEMVSSLLRIAKKVTEGMDPGRNRKPIQGQLGGFTAALNQAYTQALAQKSFQDFYLPPLPDIRVNHPDWDRLVKKFGRLNTLPLVDEADGYRLKPTFDIPAGVLAVVRHEGRLLMILRPEELPRAGGLWGLPGGVLEAGESPPQGAVRELFEELNLKGRPGRVLGNSLSFSGDYRLHWVEVAVEDISGLKPCPQEVAGVEWVAPGGLANLGPLIPGAKEQIQRILGREWR
ncbi:MAG: NUDIX domain-containing protein [Deltaproteobacteria bacterium]|nr:NUDIX domain-containing protein [Deltaproteobacteria bacterium]